VPLRTFVYDIAGVRYAGAIDLSQLRICSGFMQ